ncbi:hypothetical protein [Mycolicibacter icosiumassiliensis]|uniref:hypothetical protein n=1 Tax=Mycolicibacter icosiumassiliensis TaxID=1792835 RepID=UPI000833E662
MTVLVITGTGTGVGKTIATAALAGPLHVGQRAAGGGSPGPRAVGGSVDVPAAVDEGHPTL